MIQKGCCTIITKTSEKRDNGSIMGKCISRQSPGFSIWQVIMGIITGFPKKNHICPWGELDHLPCMAVACSPKRLPKWVSYCSLRFQA